MDVREGGAWRTTMVNKEGGRHTVDGIYRMIEPHSRLVFTWGWVADGVRGFETTVDLRFARTERGTQMTRVQIVFESSEDRDDHNMGWCSSLQFLEDFI